MSMKADRPPVLSLVVVVYNMRREAMRTLRTLTIPYQRGVTADDYEVLVVENGSSRPLSASEVTAFGPRFHYHYHDPRSPSPVAAINEAVRRARGGLIGICIDGARMFSPGLVHHAILASRLCDQPVITPLSWHLGPDSQANSILRGYNQAVEDRLLASVDWYEDGYRLFDISSLSVSCCEGFFGPLPESNCLVMRRQLYDELGGMDERFDLPGGGISNHDLLRRASDHADSRLVILLGEGTFHQVHGGVSTNAAPEKGALQYQQFLKQYREIRGEDFRPSTKTPDYFGTVPPPVIRFLEYSCKVALGIPDPPAPRRSRVRRVLSWIKRRVAA